MRILRPVSDQDIHPEEELLNMVEKGEESETEQVIPLVVEDLRRTADYAADIAEIVINMNTEASITTEEGALLKAV